MHHMRIVFLGTPDFAVASLDAIARAGHEVAGVVTAPDKPAGRGRKVQHSAVKEYALGKGYHLLQPANLKDPQFINDLRSLHADVQVVVAFRMLPEQVWNMPPLGTYNVHASLLPAYRGAAPINRAIMNGESHTGVTVFRLKHAVDTGSILLQERHEIGENITAGELHDALKQKGADLIVRALELVQVSKDNGTALRFTEQDERRVTHAPKIFRADCEIRWSRSARDVHNQVRGLSPAPGAFTYLCAQDRREHLKVLRTLQSPRPG
jgi:methionyl-tRNA formyltransferase